MTDETGLPRVLVIGETLIDVVERPGGSREEFVGGSPCNVAVGLARLGMPVELLTSIGDDNYGNKIVEYLERASVALVGGSQHHGRTSTARASLDDRGAAEYSFDIIWDLGEAGQVSKPVAVHTGSVACVLEPGATRVREEIDRLAPHATITFDPNIRPDLMGEREDARDHVEKIVRLSDVVKVSSEDIAWLYPDQDPRTVATQWLTRGPAVVFVTAGAKGSFGAARNAMVEFATPKVDVVDTVGAGDAFMAGIIEGLAHEGLLGVEAREHLHKIDVESLHRVGEFAAHVAGLTVAKAGAQPPYLSQVLASMGQGNAI